MYIYFLSCSWSWLYTTQHCSGVLVRRNNKRVPCAAWRRWHFSSTQQVIWSVPGFFSWSIPLSLYVHRGHNSEWRSRPSRHVCVCVCVHTSRCLHACACVSFMVFTSVKFLILKELSWKPRSAVYPRTFCSVQQLWTMYVSLTNLNDCFFFVCLFVSSLFVCLFLLCLFVSSLFVFLFVCLFVLVMNISFTRTVINVREGVGVVELVLRKTPGAVGPVSVLLRTHEGTARGAWIKYQNLRTDTFVYFFW